jgi:hypothetical protein
MASLERSFERKAEEAVLDDLEDQAREEIGPDLLARAQAKWIAYAAEHGYSIEHIWQDAELSVERTRRGVTIRIEWPELTALFEFGVRPHTIDGDPLLHFYWEEADQWVQTESVEWGSETGGIPESRAIRDSLTETRRDLQR